MSKAPPMVRLQAYSTPDGAGGVTIDIEGMAVDFVAACKLAELSKEEAVANFAATWDEVDVHTSPVGVQ